MVHRVFFASAQLRWNVQRLTAICVLHAILCVADDVKEERPGYCPIDPRDGVCDTNLCNGDQSCPKGLKCCPGACGFMDCLSPLILPKRPGTCPPFFHVESAEDPCLEVIRPVEASKAGDLPQVEPCVVDGNCSTSHQKCCDTWCQGFRRCKDPLPAPDFTASLPEETLIEAVPTENNVGVDSSKAKDFDVVEIERRTTTTPKTTTPVYKIPATSATKPVKTDAVRKSSSLARDNNGAEKVKIHFPIYRMAFAIAICQMHNLFNGLN